MTNLQRFILLLCLIPGLAGPAHGEEVVFGRDIRPLLSDRCFACHGPDRAGQENDLRLDNREAAVEFAIVPGDASASELIERIISEDPSTVMPPPESAKPPLSPAEVDLLKRWINEGADYTEHWAYVPPQRPTVPAIQGDTWSAGPIDAFILKEMQSRHLEPAPPADRRTLMRRLSFDLLGLPPTPEAVTAFETDPAPDACEQLVDRILQDPAFGERMAIFWLDLVRYADTCGYHSDTAREVDAYRDYVIDAFNTNKPFDEFTIEQLAGDLLPEPTIEQRIASGYNRLLQTTEEGGAQPKEYVAIYQADRVRNVSDVWLATTMGCCQCHDHKFDPLSIRDFYSMAAFFADIQEKPVGRQQPNLRLPTPEQSQQIAELEQRLSQIRNQPVPEKELLDWAKSLQARQSETREWVVHRPAAVKSTGGQTLKVQDDASVLASGKNPAKDDYIVTLSPGAGSISALRLEALTHPSLSNGSLSRANGNFVLTRIAIEHHRKDGSQYPVTIAEARADYEQPGWPVTRVLDDKDSTGWAVNGHVETKPHVAMFRFEQPVALVADERLIVTLEHRSAHGRHNIGRFRLSTTASSTPTLTGADDLPLELVELLRHQPDTLTQQQRDLLAKHYRELAESYAPQRKQIAELEKSLKQVHDSVRVMLVAEAGMPREVRILPRGNWLDDSGDVVEPAIPARFGSLAIDDRRATRLDLARWIVSPDNPLTARVFVNRLWNLCFGQGLAPLDDVGYQGAWPTHPELLDWLAVEFVESGWNVKHILRLILNSQAYRQSSISTAQKRSADPFNKWLSRQNRFRLDAEMVRDNALAVSGLLVDSLGGPSVKPYQPAGYWKHLNFPPREWQSDTDANQYRRGVYTFWCRSFLHPSLKAFDAPSREECTAERPRSNTPLQALVLLNDPTYVEAARVLAEQVASHTGTESEKLEWAFRKVLQRTPSPDEAEILLTLYQQELERYQQASDLAGQVLGNGQAPAADAVDAARVAAWTSVVRTLLNLHETITRS